MPDNSDDSLPCDVLTALICLTAFVLLVWLRERKSRNHSLPPGPFAYPIIGNILALADGKVLQTFRRYRETYGNLYTLQLGLYQTIVVNGYDNLKELIERRGDEVSDRPSVFGSTDIAKGRGLGASSGVLWRTHRSFTFRTLKLFGSAKSKMEANIANEVEILLQEIEDKNEQPFDHSGIIQASVSNVICAFVFGQRFKHTDEKFMELLNLFNVNMLLMGPSGIINFLPFLKYVPGDVFKGQKILKNDDELLDLLKKLVEDHDKSSDEGHARDYIDAFRREMKMHIIDANNTFTDQQLLRSIFDLFVAGTETTTTAIRWAILYFLHHSAVQEKMLKEMTGVVGCSRRPCLGDRTNLPYCEAVVTEVLRCGNIAPLSVFHSCHKDVFFQGYTIPEGAIIVPNLDSVLSDSRIFENADEFRPERFINENGELHGQEKVIAFSIGRRACLGETLARSELFLFLTALIQKFKFVPADDQLPGLEGLVGVTRSPKHYRIRALKRQ